MKIYSKREVFCTKKACKCWSLDDYISEITTIVYKISILGISFYKIKQFIPKIKDPTFAGEYSSNKKIKQKAIECKAEAYR